jgi:hypothetical protein
MNEFEQRLRQVPVKPLPPEWRAEILAAAGAVQPAPARPALQERLAVGWRSLFWPHPQAWAGLAAAWVVIALLHLSQRDEVPARSANSAPPSPETLIELRQQQQMLVELLDLRPGGDIDRPKKSGPHTQLMRALMG